MYCYEIVDEGAPCISPCPQVDHAGTRKTVREVLSVRFQSFFPMMCASDSDCVSPRACQNGQFCYEHVNEGDACTSWYQCGGGQSCYETCQSHGSLSASIPVGGACYWRDTCVTNSTCDVPKGSTDGRGGLHPAHWAGRYTLSQWQQ